jgi:hypothetical protein
MPVLSGHKSDGNNAADTNFLGMGLNVIGA